MDQDLDFPGGGRHHLLIVCEFQQRNSLTQGGPQPRAGTAGSERHSEAKRPSLDKSKLWPLLSQCDFVFFHVLLRGERSGADVLCLGSLGRYVSVRSQFKSKSGAEIRNTDSDLALN